MSPSSPALWRQPVHVVYGGAQLFTSETVPKLGRLAREALARHAPNAAALRAAVGAGGHDSLEIVESDAFWSEVYSRVAAKLEREAVEDYRVDFEDGYGYRPDTEEDGHAVAAAAAMAEALARGTLPSGIGIRVKSFACAARAERTLELFVSELLRRTGGRLPPGFVVTLPKVGLPAEAQALARALAKLEQRHGLASGALKCELMIETPQAILAADGTSPLRKLVEAAEGRCLAVHFGTYDYTAALEITAARQAMHHPACVFAKHVMQVALAGSGILLSDGATNVMPVGETPAVHRAWRRSYADIQSSLDSGFYQGWDLHPAQIPVRYAAVYSFFLGSLAPATARLKSFVDRAAQATLVGNDFDDAASGQGLLNFFLRGHACGALTEGEVAGAGLTMGELASRSFAAICEGRR